MKTLLSLLVTITAVTCAPHRVEKKSGKLPLAHVSGDPVAALTALKPNQKAWNFNSISNNKINKADKGPIVRQQSSSRSSFSSLVQDIDGNRRKVDKQENQVSRNGELVEKFMHQGESSGKEGGPTHSHGLTEIEVPQLNIHDRVVNKDGQVQTFKLPTKRNAPAIGHVVMEPPSEVGADQQTAEELAAYVLETGDQSSVVQFLQLMIEEGEITEREALVYVETIKNILEEAEREVKKEPVDDIEKIREMVQEKKIEEAEEEEMKKIKALRNMMEGVEKETDENDTILKINDYLESALKEGKLSRNLYNHLKEALIESVVEGLRQDSNSVDYSPY